MVTAPVATEFSRFAALRAEARGGEGTAYKAVAREFEAVFLNLLLKSARETTFQTGLMDSRQSKLYRELFDQQIALQMAQSGDVGLAETIEAQLARAAGAGPGDAPVPAALAPLSRAPAPAAAGGVGGPAPAAKVAAAPGVLAAYASPGAVPSPFEGGVARVAFTGLDARPSETQRAFLESVWQGVTDVAKRLRVAPSAVAAQAALETGWGREVIRDGQGTSSHNLFGIKAQGGWTGARVEVATHEYADGERRRERDMFRVYPNLDSALADYAALLERPRYQAVRGQRDPAAFAREIQAAGYATDPAYAEKLTRIAREIEAFGPTLARQGAVTTAQLTE